MERPGRAGELLAGRGPGGLAPAGGLQMQTHRRPAGETPLQALLSARGWGWGVGVALSDTDPGQTLDDPLPFLKHCACPPCVLLLTATGAFSCLVGRLWLPELSVVTWTARMNRKHEPQE